MLNAKGRNGVKRKTYHKTFERNILGSAQLLHRGGQIARSKRGERQGYSVKKGSGGAFELKKSVGAEAKNQLVFAGGTVDKRGQRKRGKSNTCHSLNKHCERPVLCQFRGGDEV